MPDTESQSTEYPRARRLGTQAVRLGFDFYGSGNVGDDLMFAGLLALTPKEIVLTGDIPSAHLAPMQIRFPSVRWGVAAAGHPTSNDLWLGAGGTPIQVLSGERLLRQLEQALLGRRARKAVMLGIGVEREAVCAAPRFRAVLESVDHITTRDRMAFDFLTGALGFPHDRIREGTDLANVFLEASSSHHWCRENRPVAVGLNFFTERFSARNLVALTTFLRGRISGRPWVWLFNDVRPFRHSELALYVTYRRLWNLRAAAGSLASCGPNYLSPRVEDLVSHLPYVETVIASRYHLLLAAAWYGCKVCGINRSSKIAALCADLGIPLVNTPLSRRGLERGLAAACRVSRVRLTEMAARARAVHAAGLSLLLE